MAATQLITRCDIDAKWVKQLAISENKGVYFVGVKEEKTDTDKFNINELKSVVLEIGIDVGLPTPVTMQYVTLDFTLSTASDPATNKITAVTKIGSVPVDGLQIRVANFTDINGKIYAEGAMPISINILKI